MLTTAQPAGAAPLPWHSPCVFMWIVDPAKDVESPYAVRRKNFISSIVPSIVDTVFTLTPKAWKQRLAIACEILSKQLSASTDATPAGLLDCREMS